MALIGKIRERSGLVLILITLAVAGFVIMDMTSGGPSGNSSLFDNPNTVGSVEGTKIDRNEFERVRNVVYSNSQDYLGTTNTIWNYFVEKAIVEKEATKLGLGVCKDELMDLQFSTDPSRLSPIIQQRFVDQTTGQMNMQVLQQYKQAIETNQLPDPQIRAYWAEQEKEIIKDRLQSKVAAMVSKACYTPTWQAEMVYNDQNTRSDFAYVKVPFAFVKDEEAQVTDADYKAYLAENKASFTRLREGRKVSYATFVVAATQEDSAKVRAEVAAFVPQFKAATNDSNFVLTNGGTYESAFMKKDQMSKQAADSLFAKPVGAIVGPYLDGGSYRVAKIIGRRVVADSVKARHVLFQNAAPKMVDSLFAALKDGKVSWDTLNTKYSGDKVSAAKGGDLGYFAPNMMVKEFNDLCFYKAEQGKFYKINTQFGTHIVQVTGVKNIKNEQGVKVAYVAGSLQPSQATQDKMRDRAASFVQQNKTVEALKAALEKESLVLETSQALEENDYQIGTLGANATVRKIVKWANDADAGQIDPTVYDFQAEGQYYVSKYVIAGLKSVIPAGMPSVADVKDDIEAMVKNRKKGEVLKAKLAGKDLSGALATFVNTRIDTARQATFAASFVPGLGNEPKVLANVFAASQGATTEPIIGNNGVYISQVMSRTEAVAPSDISQMKQQLANQARSQVRGRLIPSMREKASIKDYLAKTM